MRVIAGEARGHPLKAPRGLRTRPTSDLLRGTIFSMLASMGVAPSTVLDLYAGSGALGIEALSRGADWADFVDHSPAACAAIRENLTRTGFAGRARVLCLPVLRSLERLKSPFDLVFADPPYGDPGVGKVFSAQALGSIVTDQTVLVYEHSRRDSPPETIGTLAKLRTRSHGSSSVTFYGMAAADSDPEASE